MQQHPNFKAGMGCNYVNLGMRSGHVNGFIKVFMPITINYAEHSVMPGRPPNCLFNDA